MSALLEVAVAEKRYGARPVLRDVRLALRAGEIVSLIGASGCGKSSLLSIAAGLDRAFRGQVLVDGAPYDGPGPDIGMIFQEPRLFPWLTVGRNIAFGAAPGAQDQARVAALLEEVGLAGYADALPKQLSGGHSAPRSRAACSPSRASCCSTNRFPRSMHLPA